MTAAPDIARARAAPVAAVRPLDTPARAQAPAVARGLSARLSGEWLPRALWTISRTGRPGLVGMALLVASTLFLLSTHLEVAAEVEALRTDLEAAQGRAHTPDADVIDPAAATPALPDRTDMPAILSQLFNEAAQAQLAVDTAKYETSVMKNSGVVRYQIAFPVTGPYPQIRAFIDATLASMPAVALSDLVLERSSIARGNVEAQIRMTVYTRSAP